MPWRRLPRISLTDEGQQLFTEAWGEFVKQRTLPVDDTVKEAVEARLNLTGLAAYSGLVDAHRRLGWRRPPSVVIQRFLGLALFAAAGAVGAVGGTIDVATGGATGYRPAWVAMIVLCALVAVVVGPLVPRQLRPWLQDREAAVGHYRSARAFLLAALVVEVQALATSVVNENKERAKNDIAMLTSTDAPILVEIDSGDVVPSASADSLLSFIREHKTSAIGISGPRGVGKTTLMRDVQHRLADEAAALNVYLSIPVRYAAEDFIRVVFRELTRTVRALHKDYGDERVRQRSERQRINQARYFTCSILFLIGIILFTLSRYGTTVVAAQDIPGLVLMLLGVGGALATLVSSPARMSRSAQLRAPALLLAAQEAERGLDFSHMQKRTSKNTFLLKPVSAEDQDQFEQTERELTHPELVTKFKEFAALTVQETDRCIVIALDELDKVDKVKDALKFVNSIKDILHVPGVHVIVSVSEDALHSFSLRGIPLRDAFDSSFDSIVPVERLSTDESQQLLNRRVFDFPDPLILFCHALSGGVPRDLIRAARHCVDCRRSAGDVPVSVAVAVRSVLTRHSTLICEALVSHAKADAADLVGSALAALKEIRANSGATAELAESLEKSAAELAAFTDHHLSQATAVYLDLASILCRYFGQERTNDDWQTEEHNGVSTALARGVAEALELLSFDIKAGQAAVQVLRG
ncbi:P-loop NTPase fold protein [Streptomyces krungchingensis]|uniref:P-loop NTPase fold protein n=1 Tax=Streptomyces krungchingensis TaxID=1565034 RepID=UPI003CF34AEB